MRHPPGLALALISALSLTTLPSWADATQPSSPPPVPGGEDSPHVEGERREPVASLLPTFVFLGEMPRRSRAAEPDESLLLQAQELDSVLTDAIQELGFILDLSRRSQSLSEPPTELELLERAREIGALVVSPRIEPRGRELLVRITVASPDSPVLRVRIAQVSEGELAVRAAVMLRDLTSSKPSLSRSRGPEVPALEPPVHTALAVPARSAGRATLALNAAIFGGAVGYSIQRSSGSEDPRLLYPLMALGTGMGLGAAMIIAEEWDVGIGDAWYLSAGAWWPGMAGLLIADASQVDASSERYSFALAGAGAGLGLATVALTFKGMGEGGALLAHSGGAFGTFLGGLTELAVHGSADGATPNLGMGYGAAGGVLLAGALATQIQPSPSRVLSLDIGAGLGGLAGAAVTSPFLFGKRTVGRDRSFLVTTIAGTLVGGAVGWLVAPSSPGFERAARYVPMPTVVASAHPSGDSLVPVLGMGWGGEL